MRRRVFLASLPALVGVGRTYFDMGAAWQLHEGFYVPIRAHYPPLGISKREMKSYLDSLGFDESAPWLTAESGVFRLGGLEPFPFEPSIVPFEPSIVEKRDVD